LYIFLKKINIVLCALVVSFLVINATAASTKPSVQVLVSFSMPQQLLSQTLINAADLQIPAVLNGLHHNSMPETVKLIGMLSNTIPNLQLQIDPTVFERFDVQQVPALVVSRLDCFDVIYGHLMIQEGLERIAQHGSCGFKKELLQELIHE
jgi:conjugal transfer pilus assembly protein TrbC